MISVIIPIYKVEEYLRECVDSVIGQSYSDLEIILVDDGSPDCCGAICDEYAEKDSRITVIHKKNGGQSEARNVGLDMATGKYVCFVDSDDYIEKNAIKELVEYAERWHADIVFFNAELVFETDNTNLKTMKHSINYDTFSGTEILRTEFENNDVQTPAVLNFFNTDFLRKEGLRFKKGIYFEDLLLTVQSYIRSDKVYYLNQSLYCYRIRANSSMTSSPDKRHFDGLLSCVNIFRKEIDKCSEYSKKSALELGIIYAANAYLELYCRLGRKERKKHKKEIQYLRYVESQIKTTNSRKLRTKLNNLEAYTVYKQTIHPIKNRVFDAVKKLQRKR